MNTVEKIIKDIDVFRLNPISGEKLDYSCDGMVIQTINYLKYYYDNTYDIRFLNSILKVLERTDISPDFSITCTADEIKIEYD